MGKPVAEAHFLQLERCNVGVYQLPDLAGDKVTFISCSAASAICLESG